MRTFAVLFLVALATSAVADDQLGSYIYSRGGHDTNVRILNHDWPVGINMNEPFFWFSYGGRTYMIRDANTLAGIDELFAPMRALGPQHREVHARMRPLERQERDLERENRRWEKRLDAIEDEPGREGDRREFESKIHDLETKIHDIEVQLEKIEPEEEAIDKQEEQLEKEAEKQLESVAKSAIRNGTAVEAPGARP
jgi:DNA repair exonuclease SbcCD ATPase subunit